jgi:hypothetical protein
VARSASEHPAAEKRGDLPTPLLLLPTDETACLESAVRHADF